MTCIKQGIVWGVICEGIVFFPILLLPNFLMCTYLSYHKFKDNYLIVSSFDTLYLLKKWFKNLIKKKEHMLVANFWKFKDVMKWIQPFASFKRNKI